MAPRRDKTPPYEIMRSASRSSASAGGSTPTPQVSESANDASGEAVWWSWAGVGVPIILRVPRGVAILIAIGLLGLLILAYEVGYTRGWSAAEVKIAQSQEINPGAVLRSAPDKMRQVRGNRTQASSSSARGGPGQRTGTAASGRSGGKDPRKAGLNYFIVITINAPPPGHTPELLKFLADHGVETVLGSPNNNGLVPVWVVNRGFTANELYDTPAYKEWYDRLRELGRDWKDQNNRRVNPFENPYPAKYTGE